MQKRLLRQSPLRAKVETCESDLHKAPIGCPYCQHDERMMGLFVDAAEALREVDTVRQRLSALQTALASIRVMASGLEDADDTSVSMKATDIIDIIDATLIVRETGSEQP